MGATGTLATYAAIASAATTAGVAIAGAVSKPRAPGPPPLMPDQNSVLQAQQLQQAKDASLQYGRAATVLTSTGAAGANSTGDRLGP